MKFNEIIRSLREDNDMTQKEMAKVLATNQRKISRMETGDTEPNIQDIRTYCIYFKVSADYILGLPEGLKYPKR